MANRWDFSRQQRRGDDWLMQAPLLTSLLCVACVLLTGASWAAQWSHSPDLARFEYLGAESPEQIWDGHYWGLLTGTFLHANPLHLIFNLIWLYQLGSVLERSMNTLLYVLFLAAAAAVGSGCEMVLATTTGIGMSGVVYAMFGLMWAGRGRYPQWGAFATPDNLRLFVGWGIFCFVATELHWFSIANGAHAGGFLFGLSVGWIFASARPLRWLWAALLAGLIALTVLSVTWMPWSGDWDFWKGNREFERQHYARAIGWYQHSLHRGGDPETNWNNIAVAWNNLGVEATRNHNDAEAVRDLQQSEAAARQAGPDTQ